MKRLLKYYPELLFVALPLFLIVYGVYRSEIAPFEKIDFFDVYYSQEDLMRFIAPKKEQPLDIKLQTNSTVAENEKYILKKQNEGEFLLFDKETNKTRLIKGLTDADILKLVGINHLKGQCDQNSTLAANDRYIALEDNCAHLKLIEEKSQKLLKSFHLDKPVLDVKFYKHHLLYYTDALDAIDLISMQKTHTLGLKASSATLFPLESGVIVFLVTQKFDAHPDTYLLYYRYTGGTKLAQPSLYRLKKAVDALKSQHNALYMALGARRYKIYPNGREIEYAVE